MVDLKSLLKGGAVEYKDLEEALRTEAKAVAGEKRSWTAEDVAARLEKLADQLAAIRHGHQGGIDASMGKRSGWKVEI